LATQNQAYLFPLQFKNKEFQSSVEQNLKEIFQSDNIRKVGFGLSGDRSMILQKFGTEINNIVDLSFHLRENGNSSQVGTKTAAAHILNVDFKKSKRLTMSVWGMPIANYSDAMIAYAANDAHIALLVYNEWRRRIDVAKSTNCSIDGYIDWSYQIDDNKTNSDLQERVLIR
jgi:ribonuclease D